MLKPFFVALVALVLMMLAISLAVGAWKLPSPATPIPSPTGSSPVLSPTASVSPPVTPTSTPSAVPEPTPSYVPPPPPGPFTISGRGSGNSVAFQLPNVDYVVSYRFGGSCQYSADLNSSDGTYSGDGFISALRGGPINGPGSSSFRFHLQLPGSYFVAMSTDAGCPWNVTFIAR